MRALARVVAGLVAATVALGVVPVVVDPAALPAAEAAVAADFDPGNIISDQVFFAPGTMTANQVQAFLSTRGASCVAGEQACLKDYVSTTVARSPEAGLCTGYTGGRRESAAQMIVGVAASCGINPQVLLVLLEKEQSLVTRNAPTSRAYQIATGFGCPDTAPCNAQYYGLFNQLYQAARQYQRYAASPTSFGYRAGRTNTIYWHPNAACGTSQVHIANQATAGLYNYTPYRPNAAALANLYGTGDSCSAYGNRNFWRLFTDWFGSTQTSSALMRSTTSATVYLVSGTTKYPITTMARVDALKPLGSVAYVSQQYLDRRTTGPSYQGALHSSDGTIFLVDSGAVHPFTSCGQLADFGLSCSSLVSVDSTQIGRFARSTTVSNLVRTTAGALFWVTGGTKREAADAASLTAAGLPTSGVTLSAGALSTLRYGTPVARDGLLLRARTGGAAVATVAGGAVAVPPALASLPGLSALPGRPLDAASVAAATTTATLAPVSRDPATGAVQLLTTAGRLHLLDAATAGSARDVPSALLNLIPPAGSVGAPVFVKETGKGSVYLLRSGALRALTNMGHVTAIAGTPSVNIRELPVGSAALLPAGPVQVSPGTLVKSPDSGTVYLVTTLDQKVTLNSFAVTTELGISGHTTLARTHVDAYALAPGTVRTAVTCGSQTYLGLSGTLYRASADMVARYRLDPLVVDPVLCARAKVSATPLDRFLREPNGTIYLVEDGQKRPIASYGRYVEVGGTSANTIGVTAVTAARFPTGARY
jgi:hypothetical protein